MHRDADERTSHVSALQQLVDDAVHRGGGQGHRRATRERRVVESEHRARRIHQRATRKSVVDGQVESQDAIEPRTLPRAPPFADRADDAEARRRCGPRSADGEHQRSHAERSCLALRRRLAFDAGDAQRDQVGGGVAARDRRGDGVTARERDRDGVVTFDGVARADDDIVPPDHAARRDSLAGMDRHHRPRRDFDGSGQLRGEVDECAGSAGGFRGGHGLGAQSGKRETGSGTRIPECMHSRSSPRPSPSDKWGRPPGRTA
jgi:hypothetical protein